VDENVVTVLFEGGLEARRARQGGWWLRSARGANRVGTPQEIQERFGTCAVALGHAFPWGEPWALLCPGSLDDVLHVEHLVGSFLGAPGCAPRARWDTGYAVGAVLYHCIGLARAYAAVGRDFYVTTAPRLRRNGSVGVQSREVCNKAAYELDALLGAARRTYESFGRLLRTAFEGGPNRGSNYKATVRALRENGRLPARLTQRLDCSWNTIGVQVKGYRDWVAHYEYLQHVSPSPLIEMTLLRDDVWSVSMFLPDDPQTRSPQKATFGQRRDALSWGVSVAVELLDVAKAIADAVPKPDA